MRTNIETYNTTISQRMLGACVAALPAVVLGVAAIASGRIPERVRYDQMLYHEPTVRAFLAQWPSFDFYDYLSATTPGYHLLLALVARVAGESLGVMRWTSLAIGAGFAGLVGAGLASRVRPLIAGVLVWPLASSLYVGQSAAYLLPDNLAWMLVAAMVFLALRPAPRAGTYALMGVVLLALVFTRQIHLWTAGLVVCAAWMSGVPREERYVGPALLADLRARVAPVVMALVAVVPAVLLLERFVTIWGGLVPARFAGQYHAGFNTASVAFFLALLALASAFFAPILWPRALMMWRERRGALLGAGCSGALAAILAPTTYDYAAGRRTGLWNLAAKLPEIGRTSVLILALSALGGAALAAWVWPMRARDKLTVLAALAGFWLALAASVELWQRYTEPFLLLMVALMSAMTLEREASEESRYPGGWTRWWALSGPVVLAVCFAALSGRSLSGAARITDPPPPSRAPDDTSPIQAPVDVVPPPPEHGRTLW